MRRLFGGSVYLRVALFKKSTIVAKIIKKQALTTEKRNTGEQIFRGKFRLSRTVLAFSFASSKNSVWWCFD